MPTALVREEVTGLILAGGRGSRMGGVDKGLQTYHDQPLSRWMVERLGPQVGRVMINANRNLDVYRTFGIEVCTDETNRFDGPLAGVLSGMTHCRTPFMATAPCDSPGFPIDLVARLGRALEVEQARIAVAVVSSPSGRRIQPVFALLDVALEPSLRKFMSSGGTKVREWMFSHSCAEVEFDDPTAFANINTLDDLQRAQPDA